MDSLATIIIELGISSTLLYFLVWIVQDIKQYGFRCGNVFFSVCCLFYGIIPLLYLVFDSSRDHSTIYNILLSSHDDIEIASVSFICMLVLVCMKYVYSNKLFENRNGSKATCRIEFKNEPRIDKTTYSRLLMLAHLVFFLGGLSVIACIVASGGVSNYLALGSQTRGISNELTGISSSMLPLITLSSIVIAAPYLYYFLMKERRARQTGIKALFVASFIISLVYLLYNQGRLPLILFIVPFVLNCGWAKKAKLLTIVVLAIASIITLDWLSDLFLAFSYGKASVGSGSESSFIETLLLEFTYPFSNILNMTDLVDVVGFRVGTDYVQWPLTVLPSSLLETFGITKSDINTTGSLNTLGYAVLTGRIAEGGIPTDFFTFNYYQFGFASLVVASLIASLLLRKLDELIERISNITSISIVCLRVSILLMSLINNFDLSVIFRTRLDFIILVAVIVYVARKRDIPRRSEIVNEISSNRMKGTHDARCG